MYLVKHIFFEKRKYDVKKQKFKNNHYFLIIMTFSVLSVFSLNALMHAVANTGLEFIRYNNRALVSLSFIIGFIFIILFNFFERKYIKNLIAISFIFFSIFLTKFIFFQNNLINERFIAKNVVKKEIFSNKNFDTSSSIIIFVILDMPKIRSLMSYGTYDSVKIYIDSAYLSYEKKPRYYFMSENKFCNKDFYNEYIKTALLNKRYNYNIINLKKK